MRIDIDVSEGEGHFSLSKDSSISGSGGRRRGAGRIGWDNHHYHGFSLVDHERLDHVPDCLLIVAHGDGVAIGVRGRRPRGRELGDEGWIA